MQQGSMSGHRFHAACLIPSFPPADGQELYPKAVLGDA